MDRRRATSWTGRGARAAALLAGSLAGCETQDCPADDDSIGAFVTALPGFVADECVVLDITRESNFTNCAVSCAENGERMLAVRTRPFAVVPWTVGQALRLRFSDNLGDAGSHRRQRVEIDDAATSRMLIRAIADFDYENNTSADFEDLELAPFSFGNELACRPVPGTRGDVRLAFDVTLDDTTIRMYDSSSATLGEFTIWITAGQDGEKRIFVMRTS